jgi:hypothetical protein
MFGHTVAELEFFFPARFLLRFSCSVVLGSEHHRAPGISWVKSQSNHAASKFPKNGGWENAPSPCVRNTILVSTQHKNWGGEEKTKLKGWRKSEHTSTIDSIFLYPLKFLWIFKNKSWKSRSTQHNSGFDTTQKLRRRKEDKIEGLEKVWSYFDDRPHFSLSFEVSLDIWK